MEKEILIIMKESFINRLNETRRRLIYYPTLSLKIEKAQLEGLIEGLAFEIENFK